VPRRNRLRPSAFFRVLKTAFLEFVRGDRATLGAALAYYTVFSIAPVLVIAIAVAGLVFGRDAVEDRVREQMAGLVGNAGATQIQTMVQGAYNPGRGVMATVIAAVVLALSATVVFGQLRTSLDVIWSVKPRPGRGYLRMVLNRVFSFAMVVTLGFLLLVSLVLQAALVAATSHLRRFLPEEALVGFQVVEVLVSTGITTVLFLIVYRFLSDARVAWRDCLAGALFTAILFTAGKYAIGLYLGHSKVMDTYGVAGSLVLVLLWVFYTSQIVFFGAEFTQAFAKERGAAIVPGEYAIAVTPEQVSDAAGKTGRVRRLAAVARRTRGHARSARRRSRGRSPPSRGPA
jgi:membrane protein